MKQLFLILMAFVVAFFVSTDVDAAKTTTGLLIDNMDAGSMGLATIGMIGSRRDIYDRVKAANPNKIIVPGYLRVESEIETSKNSYSLNFSSKTNVDGITENRLDNNDSFVITEIGIFLIKKNTDYPNAEVLQAYPNAAVFADGTTFKGANLECIYNGKVNFSVGNTNFLEKFPMDAFRSVGAMASSSATTYSQKNAADGFVEMTPNVGITGLSKHELRIDIPSAGLHLTNDTPNMSNHIVVIARGFLVK